MKQEELDGDPEFTVAIGLRGKSASYWETNKRQSWKWKEECRAYKNPILKFDVGHMSCEKKKKACGA